MPKKSLLVLAVLVFGGIAWYAVTHTKSNARTYVQSEALLVDDRTSAELASVKQYKATILTTLQSDRPVLQISKPTAEQNAALSIVLADRRLPELVRDQSGNTYRVEVMQSYQLPVAQATGQLEQCVRQRCYRLDMYNFTRNSAVVAVVDVDTQQLLSMQSTASQPDVSSDLATLATDIANHNQLVKKTLADHGLPLMAGTKTALGKTVCEKSQHLCVAPTYVESAKQRALWVIVDLTDLKVVGTAWTKWDDKPTPITERQLTSQAVKSLCGKVSHAERAGWAFDYTLTGSDGLEIRNLSYKGQAVLASAKTVDWHVSYSSRDGFGYSDAMGCPEFSTAAVVPSGLPKLSDGVDGQVVFTMDFRGEKWPDPCNYYYRQQFEMNRDGSVRVAVANVGRGCGDDGTYRPVTRIALPAAANQFKRIDAAGSQAVTQEDWWQPGSCQSGQDCTALAYKLGQQSYDVIPANGQFGDAGRGDNPFLYLTSASGQKLEGQDDLLTIGSCCNTDYQQGPEKFINNEPLSGKPVILWYVAQVKNSGVSGQEYCWATGSTKQGRYNIDEYPCYSGPLIKPQSAGQ